MSDRGVFAPKKTVVQRPSQNWLPAPEAEIRRGEDGVWRGRVPALSGVEAKALTYEQVAAQIKRAAFCAIAELIRRGEPAPFPMLFIPRFEAETPSPAAPPRSRR